ncbi:hypothetical protein [Mycolicibacter minnesotensis]
MTDVAHPDLAGGGTAPESAGRRDLRTLADARAVKLARLVLPPSHEAVLDVVAQIWLDGVEVGLQMTQPSPPAPSCVITDALESDLYTELAGAALCGQYDEFPELDDPDFQDLAYQRVGRIGRATQPIGHPESTWDTVEVWTDGVAAALRVARNRKQRFT